MNFKDNDGGFEDNLFTDSFVLQFTLYRTR